MSRRTLFLTAILSSGLCVFGGYRLRVLAEGAPDDPSLFYSGTLEQDGERVNGDFTVTLALFSAARGGNELCRVESATTVENGGFRIDATDCEGAVRENANTWVEVSFTGGDGVERRIEGRSKLGAVPYAIEADRAVVATSAETASGQLEARLQALTERVAALEAGTGNDSAFQAVRTMPLTVVNNTETFIAFDNEVFDYGDEYDHETGVFSPKKPGVYAFTCTVAWNPPAGDVVTWEATLHWDKLRIFSSKAITDGQETTRSVNAVMRLQAGDEVQCGVWHTSAGPQPLYVDWAVTTFDGHRVAKY